MIRILIVDDQKSVREKLKILLEQEPNLEVVGTAEDGYEALEGVVDLSPDIVIMDMIMTRMDGVSATQIICQNYPQTKIIGLSSFESKDLIDQFLRVGGKGYLFKHAPIDELAASITLVHKGYVQIGPSLINQTERNTSGVVKFAPVTSATKSDTQVQTVQKQANSSKNSVNRLKDSFSPNKQDSPQGLDIVPTTPKSIVPTERQITKGTIVPIEANELLPSVSNWTILGGLVTASAIAVATIMAAFTQYKVVVKGEATVRPAGELRLVQAATEGPIIDISTKINQPIKRGDIIATLDSSKLQTQKNPTAN